MTLLSPSRSPSAFRLVGQRSYAIFVWKEGEPGNEASTPVGMGAFGGFIAPAQPATGVF